jgi:hypothetical protein
MMDADTMTPDEWDEYVERQMDREFYGEDGDIEFADPGGNSALRAASKRNPRNLPCPNCEMPDRLTPADVALGYQCDPCADRAESGREY